VEASEVLATDPGAAGAAAPSRPERKLLDLLPAGQMRLAVVVAGGALVVASVVLFGASSRALVGVIFCPIVVLLAAIDARHRVLPNAIVFPGVLALGLALAATDADGFVEHLEAALALGGFLFLFAAVFPSGLGLGDAKVGFLLGLALGSRTLSAMMIALFGLFLAALWIVSRQGVSARKQSIPFGPFIAIGGIVAYFLT
jgi:prepilin signal peptidase PulO-like enzyme (type II secretory pathway)